MKLSICMPEFYRVKKGQTLREIAFTFGIPPRVLARENELSKEVYEGQVLRIPSCRGNLYTVRGGESKTLLCGSRENFEKRNGTKCLYPTQVIVL
ncbi:MAG: LysM peptidoglycan-binding domain-containing protein [Clostridia bacterium]|nr:LysM peptidoglycan-binding domain-containing protein [Clostridia bacterium]